MYSGSHFVWREPLNPTEKLVLLFLCETSDFYGRCNFSSKLLQDSCSLTEETVCAVLVSLEGKKIISNIASVKAHRAIEPWLSAMIMGVAK